MDTSADSSAEDEEAKVRHHADRLRFGEGRPEGRADEHWRLAAGEAVAPSEARGTPFAQATLTGSVETC